ncbi:general substrate transporter [Kockiozyma suomiensis]|uniref:general substrate transporter n=1 Tax=Kockiozyma suomiensis TaxID=1337062 RepID=UPI003344373E
MVLKTYNPYVVAMAATIGGMLFGFDVSSVSAFVNNETYRAYFNYPNDIVQGAITSAMAGGSFFGSLISGRLSDALGRKYAVQIGAVIWIVGSLFQSAVLTSFQLIMGRFISGIAIGICSSQVPVYIAELSPKRIRGRLVGTFQWAITWGVLIMFLVGYGCSFIEGPKSFRIAWGLQVIPGLLLLCALFFFPESPRWLATRDRWEEATNVIAHIQGGGDVEHPDVLLEMQEIREVVRINRMSEDVTVMDLFARGSRLRTFVGCSCQMWQQLTGINVMMYYVVYTFAMAGYEGNTDLIASSVQYAINVFMTVPALLFIDDWGRRPLLLTGSTFMALWLFCVAFTMGHFGHYVDSLNGNTEIRWIVPNHAAAKSVIAFNYLFVGTFAPTYGPGTWIYVSEIFPLKQRAIANGLCAAVNWTFNFLLAFLVPLGFKHIQYRTYLIFCFFCILMTLHVYFMFPETKGKTLEEIDLIWEDHIPPWKTSKIDVEEFVARDREHLINHESNRAPTELGEMDRGLSPADTNSGLSTTSYDTDAISFNEEEAQNLLNQDHPLSGNDSISVRMA